MRARGIALLIGSSFALLVSGCSASNDLAGPAPSAPTTVGTTAPVPPTVRGSTGCTGNQLEAGAHEYSFLVDGYEYRYRMHVPRSAEPLPTVVGFHGFTQPVGDFEEMSDLPAHGDENGYLVVLPSGVGDVFAPLPGANVDAVATMLDEVAGRVCLDLDRVYATGISMGGTFTSLVGCELADRFAAIAPVAGSYFPPTCPTARPVPAQIFHGTADPRNPFEGTADEAPPALIEHSRPIADSAARWAQRNGCSTTTSEDRSVADVARIRWDCPEGAEVELVRLEGGGHQWPGDLRGGFEDLLGPTISSIDATDTMWAFFAMHSLSTER